MLDGPDDGARELSRAFLYWMQAEQGLPGLRLRSDVTGDGPGGLAKAPYVREARRIRAVRTVVEQDIALEVRGAPRRGRVPGRRRHRPLSDRPASLHRRRSVHRPPVLPVPAPARRARARSASTNLLAAGKAMGTTHITNGAFRLHPVEWNAGEAAGHLAAHCHANRTTPHAVAERPEALQGELDRAGIERAWPDAIRRPRP